MQNLEHSISKQYFSQNAERFYYFIGGSTMSGKGIKSKTYPELISEKCNANVFVITKDLISIEEVNDVIVKEKLTGVVVINCGAGDQLRKFPRIIQKLIPTHWNIPGHMEPPIIYSSNFIKRYRQKILIGIKFLIKSSASLFGIYRSRTTLKKYSREIERMAEISISQNIRLFWIGSVTGDFRIPKFIRREKNLYCNEIPKKYISKFLEGSRFISVVHEITDKHLLDDNFHLNAIGHEKLCSILLENSIYLER